MCIIVSSFLILWWEGFGGEKRRRDAEEKDKAIEALKKKSFKKKISQFAHAVFPRSKKLRLIFLVLPFYHDKKKGKQDEALIFF